MYTVIYFWCKSCGKKAEVHGMVPKHELCSVCEEKTKLLSLPVTEE